MGTVAVWTAVAVLAVIGVGRVWRRRRRYGRWFRRRRATPPPWPPQPATVAEALDILRTADSYAPVGTAIGYAALLPETDGAWHMLHNAGAAAVPGLWRLLDDATPSGRVHAAQLLGTIDPAEGHAAWQRLATDQAEFTLVSGGCTGFDETTVGAFARSVLHPADEEDLYRDLLGEDLSDGPSTGLSGRGPADGTV